MPTLAERRASYSDLISRALVRPEWKARIEAAAQCIVRNKATYLRVQAATGVPWDFVGALHWRESACNFTKHLHNGDPLTARTRRIPAGRPPGTPPFTWWVSAIDALQLKGMHKWTDWSLEGRAYKAEEFNGWGYYLNGFGNSPYLWSGMDVYARGKYYEDRKFSPTIVDAQVGVMPIMLRIKDLEHRAVVEDNSRKVSVLRRVTMGIQAAFTALAAVFSLDNLSVFTGWLSPMSGLIDAKTLGVVIVAGIGILFLSRWLIELTHEDYAQGRYDPSGVAPKAADAPPPEAVV